MRRRSARAGQMGDARSVHTMAASSATSAASATEAMKFPSSSSAVAMSVAICLMRGVTASSSASQNVFPSTSLTSSIMSALSKAPVSREAPAASSALHATGSTYMATAYTLTLMMAIFFSRTPAPTHVRLFNPSSASGKVTFVAGSVTARARTVT